jgi:hypothetical protein
MARASSASRAAEQGVPLGRVDETPAQQQIAGAAVRLAVTLRQAPLVDPDAARVDQPRSRVGDGG